jgi:K(+)-stimulated pyrophosphate-energized sodium pump
MVFGMKTLAIAEMLGGYMAGVTVSGVLWAIFQNNAGGAWDNAKKSFEAGVMINGEMTYKGSDAHKAAVTGDTVGDPFKDTSGPSMNILIKLTCLIGLVIAPILGGHSSEEKASETTAITRQVTTTTNNEMIESVDIQKSIDAATGMVTALVTVTKKINGVKVKKEQTYKGTAAEVDASIAALDKELSLKNFK